MGQITNETIAMIRRAVDAGQAPPLTLWEYTQLAFLAEKQLSPAAQWQKRHENIDDGQWQNTNEADAKWWRDNSKGWEIRTLFEAQK